MEFERPRHRIIALLLQMLDAPRLRAHHCLLGGGTAIAMRFGEYRESVDVDFLVSSATDYRDLRQVVREHDSLTPLLRSLALQPGRVGDIRADQYGIRARLEVADQPVKFEIVREARIELDKPGTGDELCGIATLSVVDMASCKLLANSDRFLDDSTFNRDLIDLAMLAPNRQVLKTALAKAETAYGDSIRRDLSRAAERLRQRDGWLDACVRGLAINVPNATLWQRVRDLLRTADRIQPA